MHDWIVDEDLADGRRNGVTGTPTLFVILCHGVPAICDFIAGKNNHFHLALQFLRTTYRQKYGVV